MSLQHIIKTQDAKSWKIPHILGGADHNRWFEAIHCPGHRPSEEGETRVAHRSARWECTSGMWCYPDVHVHRLVYHSPESLSIHGVVRATNTVPESDLFIQSEPQSTPQKTDKMVTINHHTPSSEPEHPHQHKKDNGSTDQLRPPPTQDTHGTSSAMDRAPNINH